MIMKYFARHASRPEIIEAAWHSQHRRVARLLARGADVNAVEPGNNLSLLHIAAHCGDTTLANLVLKRDREHSDVDFTIRSQFPPLLAWQWAAKEHHWKLAAHIHDAAIDKEIRRQSMNRAPV